MKLKLRALIAAALFVLLLLPGRQAQAEAGPPEIPEGGFFLQEYVLPKGLKLPVYRGPGEEFGRAAGGKALLATNGWVQIFGKEGDWLLVQYEINEGQMRFGYVSSKKLPAAKQGLRDLGLKWWDEDFVLPVDAVLTDDPLGARGTTERLPAGSNLRFLDRMGLWMYVQAKAEGKDVRGFLRMHFLRGIPQRDESIPFDLRAVSWGPTEPDEATDRYLTKWSMSRAGRWPGIQAPYPNVWLRLESAEYPEYLEELYNFRVVSGRAVSSGELIPLDEADDLIEEWILLHFNSMGETSRSALEIFMEPGESVENLVIAADRIRSDNSRETITLPLGGVPLDRGIPDEGVSFAMLRYTPYNRARFKPSPVYPDTLGGLVGAALQEMPEAPQEVLNLPLDTPGYRFYLLEGMVTKEIGPFGVFDIVFILDNPPPGVWLAGWQNHDAYAEIYPSYPVDSDAILPDDPEEECDDEDSFTSEENQKYFAMLLLVEEKGRDEVELDRFIKGLSIHTSFSAEQWSIRDGRGGRGMAVGPRSTRQVAMDQLVQNEEVLLEQP